MKKFYSMICTHLGIPTSIDDSLSYYEVLCKLAYGLDELGENQEKLEKLISDLQTELENEITARKEAIEALDTKLKFQVDRLDNRINVVQESVQATKEELEIKIQNNTNLIANLEVLVPQMLNILREDLESQIATLSNTTDAKIEALDREQSAALDDFKDKVEADFEDLAGVYATKTELNNLAIKVQDNTDEIEALKNSGGGGGGGGSTESDPAYIRVSSYADTTSGMNAAIQKAINAVKTTGAAGVILDTQKLWDEDITGITINNIESIEIIGCGVNSISGVAFTVTNCKRVALKNLLINGDSGTLLYVSDEGLFSVDGCEIKNITTVVYSTATTAYIYISDNKFEGLTRVMISSNGSNLDTYITNNRMNNISDYLFDVYSSTLMISNNSTTACYKILNYHLGTCTFSGNKIYFNTNPQQYHSTFISNCRMNIVGNSIISAQGLQSYFIANGGYCVACNNLCATNSSQSQVVVNANSASVQTGNLFYNLY